MFVTRAVQADKSTLTDASYFWNTDFVTDIGVDL